MTEDYEALAALENAFLQAREEEAAEDRENYEE